MRNFKAEAQRLFDAQTMAELAEILGMTGDAAIAAFQIGLIDLLRTLSGSDFDAALRPAGRAIQSVVDQAGGLAGGERHQLV